MTKPKYTDCTFDPKNTENDCYTTHNHSRVGVGAMPVIINIDVMMARRKMSLGELAERVDITPANLSILKNGKARAIRFSTLEAICRVLECQPGDIIEYRPDKAEK